VSNEESRFPKKRGRGGGGVAVHVVDRAEKEASSHPIATRSITKNTVEEVVVARVCGKTPNSQRSRSSGTGSGR
jgi:hypothetical protein